MTVEMNTSVENVSYYDYTSFCAGYFNDEPTYVEPTWLQIIFGVIFGLITVFGIGGNAIVCYIVLGHRRMRTVTN